MVQPPWTVISQWQPPPYNSQILISPKCSFAIYLRPVVQSIVSLMSSLRGQLVKCFRLYNKIHWYFLLKKWERLLHCKSFSHFFNKKYWHISDISVWKFNETLTNDVVSFEQLGPDLSIKVTSQQHQLICCPIGGCCTEVELYSNMAWFEITHSLQSARYSPKTLQ